MEYTRDFKVTVYRDTNKNTYTDTYENAVDAIVGLAKNLRGNEEALIAIQAIAEAINPKEQP